MFLGASVPRSSLLPSLGGTPPKSAHTSSSSLSRRPVAPASQNADPKYLKFVVEDDPFAFTEANSSMWTTNDPVRVVQVAKRKRLSAGTERVDRMRAEERAHVEDIDDHEPLPLPRSRSSVTSPSSSSSRPSSSSSAATTPSATAPGSSSRTFSSFRFTTSLQLAQPEDEGGADDGMELARDSTKRKLEDVGDDDTEKSKQPAEEQKNKKKRRIEVPASLPVPTPLSEPDDTPASDDAIPSRSPFDDAHIGNGHSATLGGAPPGSLSPRASGLPQKLKVYARKKTLPSSPPKPSPTPRQAEASAPHMTGIRRSPPRSPPAVAQPSVVPLPTPPAVPVQPNSAASSSPLPKSPSPSSSSLSPVASPASNKPPIKFTTPERKLALKHSRAHTTSPSSTTTTPTPTTKPTTPERPSASRFVMAEQGRSGSGASFSSQAQPRYMSPGSLAPPNLGELTRKLRQSSSSPGSSSASQVLSSSPFRQLRVTSSPPAHQSSSSSSSSYGIVPLPTAPSSSSSSSSSSALLRSPEKQLSAAMQREMQLFRRSQEKRARSFQLEVQEGLSPFRGRKLFPEPDIDDFLSPPKQSPEQNYQPNQQESPAATSASSSESMTISSDDQHPGQHHHHLDDLSSSPSSGSDSSLDHRRPSDAIAVE